MGLGGGSERQMEKNQQQRAEVFVDVCVVMRREGVMVGASEMSVVAVGSERRNGRGQLVRFHPKGPIVTLRWTS